MTLLSGLSRVSPPRNLGGGPCFWRRRRSRAKAPSRAAPVGLAQGPLRETVRGVEPLLPRDRLGEREVSRRPRFGRTARGRRREACSG